jgi:hypothetical protein
MAGFGSHRWCAGTTQSAAGRRADAMIVAVGGPAPDAQVPGITQRPLDEVLAWR